MHRPEFAIREVSAHFDASGHAEFSPDLKFQSDVSHGLNSSSTGIEAFSDTTLGARGGLIWFRGARSGGPDPKRRSGALTEGGGFCAERRGG